MFKNDFLNLITSVLGTALMILLMILGIVFIAQAFETKTTVTVPLTEENCWTTYQVNQECFNDCLK
jgi:hypothetical protein